MVQSPDRPFPSSLRWALAVYAFCFLAVYLALQLKYRVGEIDDTLWIGFAYNLLHRHTLYDLITGTTLSYGGILHFGETYSYLLGTSLDLFGWTKPHGYFLSLSLLAGGFICWYFTLRALHYSRELSAVFCVTGLLLDPFFSAALSIRSEAFVFCASSLALLFFVREWYFVAMLAAWMGLETHPTGAVAFFLMAAALWAKNPKVFTTRPQLSRGFWLALAGFGAGVLYYIILRPSSLVQLPSVLSEANQPWSPDAPQVQNFLFDYFFHSKFNRHLAELALLLLCAFEFFRKKTFRKDPFVLPLTLSLLAFSLVFRRPNYHYVLYFYPVFLLMLAKVFETHGKLTWMVWGLLAFMFPQYAFAYHLNKDYDYNFEVQNVRKIVPDDSLPILGEPNTWFVYPSRDFYHNQYSGDLQKLGLTRFYLVHNQDYWQRSSTTTAYIRSHFQPKPLGEFAMGRWKFFILLEEPLPAKKP